VKGTDKEGMGTPPVKKEPGNEAPSIGAGDSSPHGMRFMGGTSTKLK